MEPVDEGWRHGTAPPLECSPLALHPVQGSRTRSTNQTTPEPPNCSKPLCLLLCLGPNEGVKSTVRVKRSPATTMHGLASAPQTAAARPLHPFPKHHACSWGCGKFQKKSKIRPSLLLSRVPETPSEFHKFRRLLASLCKPESKFLVSEPSFDTSR